jgi:hypothetical protein
MSFLRKISFVLGPLSLAVSILVSFSFSMPCGVGAGECGEGTALIILFISLSILMSSILVIKKTNPKRPVPSHITRKKVTLADMLKESDRQ